MSSGHDQLCGLTDHTTPMSEKRDLAKDFAFQFGWRPHDFLDAPTRLIATSIVVEQGLDNAAVLSFLPHHLKITDLQLDDRRMILQLSYNSLVDWHVWISREEIQYVYNRIYPPAPTQPQRIDSSNLSALAKDVFDEATGRAPSPNLPTLDAALLETISNWRRILQSQLDTANSQYEISSLFNAIIFTRAIEDYTARLRPRETHSDIRDCIKENGMTISEALRRCVINLTGEPVSPTLIDYSALEIFDSLPPSSMASLVEAFYRNPSIPYDYDFSVISKHALSKIYERYIAVMNSDQPVQFTFLPESTEQSWTKHLGGIYTLNILQASSPNIFTSWFQQPTSYRQT